jgi:hypothetical protein
MKLSVIFLVLNQLKVDHWQTKKHSEHIALGQAYEALDDLFDRFVEVFYGRVGVNTNNKITYAIKVDSYSTELIKNYTQMRDNVILYLRDLTAGYDMLKNIQDEIEAEFDQLIYKLNQS